MRPSHLVLTSRLVAVFLCIVAGVAGPGAIGEGGAVAEARRNVAVEVAGTTHVVGSRSAAMTVTLPEPAEFDPKTGPNPAFTISGKGRFIGVLLVQRQGGLDHENGTSLFVGQYGFCDRPGCDPGEDAQQFLISRGDRPGVLPAGEYALFFFADGARSRVSMRFESLSGTATLVPKAATETSIFLPETQFDAPGNVAYATAHRQDFNGIRGVTFEVMRLSGDLYAGGRYGSCLYRGEPLLPEPLAYITPECPGGLSSAVVDATTRSSRFAIDYYGQTIADPGPWTFGLFYQAAGILDEEDALVVSLDVPESLVTTLEPE